MPPKKYARNGAVASAGAAKKKKDTGDEEAIGLPAQLERLRQRREALERRLEVLDLRVYDAETVYLRRHVELGGCLFDGFGVERQRQWPGVGVNQGAAAAYRARLQCFTPNDRVFTASSIGALGLVERLKICKAAGGWEDGERRKRLRTES